jgi:hypothetical protein
MMAGLFVIEIGGKMITDWYRRTADCRHEATVSVISGGIEREICEGCGNVTLRYESFITGTPDRSKFAREADKRAAHLAVNVG